ncbi:kinase-like domain-containing protein [Crassisporium funariophilum]|nr:kinase-like domain-containing protein [Crassisporium funariophilum]
MSLLRFLGILRFLESIKISIGTHLRRLFLPFLLRRSRKIYPKIARNVTRLTKTTVVKTGPPWQLHLEAQATRFAALHTTIPVPAVYDCWTGRDGQGYLVMEFKDGEVLQRQWRKLSEPQKMSVLRTLVSYVEELRALHQPYPQGWIGSLSREAVFDFAVRQGDACGPFSDQREFNNSRVTQLIDFSERHPPTVEALRQVLAEMPDNHQITFTHGDIARYNILVSVEGEDARITALLDWEQAGWRPEYWEAYKFLYNAGDGDWNHLGRQHVVPGYDEEINREYQVTSIAGFYI